MNFKKIELDDIDRLRKYLYASGSRMCDFAPGSIMMWGDFFYNGYLILGDTLVISGRMPDGRVFYSIVNNRCNKNVFDELKAYSLKEYGYFILFPVEKGEIETCLALSSEQPEIVLEEDWFDYLYLVDDLIALKGSKYHGKRNFVNRFIRENPDAYTEELNANNLERALMFLRAHKAEAGAEPWLNTLSEYEHIKTEELLHDYYRLPFIGMILYRGDEVAGFSVGEISGDTIFVHVEKAERSIPGAYQYLSNKFLSFIKSRYPDIVYVNREEDVGDPGLRESKESYHPVEKLYKYNLIYKK